MVPAHSRPQSISTPEKWRELAARAANCQLITLLAPRAASCQLITPLAPRAASCQLFSRLQDDQGCGLWLAGKLQKRNCVSSTQKLLITLFFVFLIKRLITTVECCENKGQLARFIASLYAVCSISRQVKSNFVCWVFYLKMFIFSKNIFTV